MTIHVLGFGELYVQLLNAISVFMKQDGFFSFLRITALIGIIMASIGYIKQRDPMVYAKWVLGYVLVFQVVILPKTTVAVFDVSKQSAMAVDNVPVVFATTASLITGIGVGLAETYDELLTLPDDLRYTKTGSLFGSKMIQAAHDFRIINPDLKAEMDGYLRNCVVGDIRLNQKYSMDELSNSTDIASLITRSASPIRMTPVNGQLVTCLEAAKPEGAHSLRAKLNAEIINAYTFFGINLFGSQKETSYQKLFETNLTSSFNYYQNMTDSSANIFMQSMMINAIGDGISNYQAFTDSTAGVVNNQVTKAEVQHRWAWAIAGQKAAWALPLLYSVLTVLLFGIFPIIIVMSTLPNGIKIFQGYVQFFITLQFWPVLFAIFNAAMTQYGQTKSQEYGAITLVNIDKIDELHSDLSGMAGYLMLMIPFIAKGLVSSLSDAFNNLATSMTSHFQGSAMSVANDAASASFGLGQTSFYNTSANSMSANKHDTNWTNMHGMRTEQLSTGVTKTRTGSGDTVFDVSPGMTKSALAINITDGLNGSFNEAAEDSRQASVNAHQSFQTSLSNLAHKALSLSQVQGHDMRLGAGVSTSETGQYQQSLSTMSHIASDVAQRRSIGVDESMANLIKAGMHGQVNLPPIATGAIRAATRGLLDVSGSASLGTNRTSTSSDRTSDSFDSGISARESADFNAAFSHVQHFVKNHHFDDSQSSGANLSNQLGADLRGAEVASKNYDASMARSARISQATSYVKSQGDQITRNLEQEFPAFVESRVGGAARDALFSHPGDSKSNQSLQGLSHDFLQHEREGIISSFDRAGQGTRVDGVYQQGAADISKQSNHLDANYETAARGITRDASSLSLGAQGVDKAILEGQVNQGMTNTMDSISTKQQVLQDIEDKRAADAAHHIEIGRENAMRGVALYSSRNNDDKREVK